MQAQARPKLRDNLQEEVVDTQFGSGLNKGWKEATHLYTKSLIDVARSKNLFLSIIYADVRTAFASMIRTVAFLRQIPALRKKSI